MHIAGLGDLGADLPLPPVLEMSMSPAHMCGAAFSLLGLVWAQCTPNRDHQRRLRVCVGCYVWWIVCCISSAIPLCTTFVACTVELVWHWEHRLAPLQLALLWLLWIAFPCVLSLLRTAPSWHDPVIVTGVTGIVALVDMGGWMGGKLLGQYLPWKPWVIRDVSPNKTVIGYVVGGLFGLAFGLTQNVPNAAVLVVSSVFGDLIASWVKRRWGVGTGGQDFGWMMGSHGGVLDRMDSHLVAQAVYAGFALGGS